MTVKKTDPIEVKKPELKKIMVHGDTYHTTFTKKYQNRQKWVKPDPKEVVSIIPGTIRQVLVKEGDRVSQSDKLLVLEAMKMMNTISAPVSGTVKSIRVKEGDCVPKGTLMIEIE
jgi:biotin carboxyl carrier protein